MDWTHILARVATGDDVQGVLGTIVDLLEHTVPEALAVVMLCDDDGLRLRPGAVGGLPAPLLAAIAHEPIARGASPCASAVLARRMVVAPDLGARPAWSALAALASDHGLRACSSLPIVVGEDDVAGTVALFGRAAAVPSNDMLQLQTACTHLAGIALRLHRKHTDLALSERRFQGLFEHNPNAVISLDVSGRVLRANAPALAMLDLAPAALQGTPLTRLMPQADWPGTDDGELLAHWSRHGAQDTWLLDGRGRRREVSLTVFEQRADERVHGYLLIATDVSAQRRQLRQLMLQAQVIDRAHDAVVVADDAGIVASWNQGATRLYGVEAADAIGQDVLRALPLQDTQAFSKVLWRVTTGHEDGSAIELPLRDDDGPPRHVSLALRRLAAAGDSAVHTVIYGLDVTQRRRSEDAQRAALARANLQSERLMQLSQASVEISRLMGRDTLLQRIVDDARQVIGAHVAMVSLSEDAGWEHAVQASSMSGKYPSRDDLVASAGHLGLHAVAQELVRPIAMRRDELERHPRWLWNGVGEDPAAGTPLRGWLAAPLPGRDGKPIGLLQLSDKTEGDFSQDDVAIAMQFAQTAAATLEAHALVEQLAAAESRLQAQLDFTSAITHSVGESLLVIGIDGALRFANPALHRLLGLAPDADPTGALSTLWLGNAGLLETVRAVQADGVHREGEDGHSAQGDRRIHLSYSVAPLRLRGACDGAVVVLRDITDRKRYEADIARQATHDTLTGLPNRMLLQDRLRQAMALSRRSGRLVAVMVVDLDEFRVINDTLGHDSGDRLLCQVAARLAAGVRDGDTVCRLGSDEFVIVLPDVASTEDLPALAQRTLEQVAQPYVLDGGELHLSCSIGVAVAADGAHDAEQSGGDDPTVLIQRADLAMYQAKKAGRNTYHLFSGQLDALAAERLMLRNDLQGAIASGAFELHYQPQFDLASGRLCGVEALIRWQHPVHGLIYPARFIALAEDTGQIVPIGAWVLERACRDNKAWIDRGLLDVPVAVNISSVQFQRPNFVDGVRAVLVRTGLPANRLELELTESVMMDRSGAALQSLQALREMGVGLSVDDFGTGFSSLSYLRRFPFDKVKIDRSFIQDVTRDSDEASITLSIIAIAHHLRLRVIAEGVETAGQVAYLRRHLCDEIQGYHAARPMDAAALEAFVLDPQRATLAWAGPSGDERPVVLLVDDEANILRALTRTLRRDGYRILTASSAREAFELLARNDVNLILSDQRMPEMSGTEFLGEVKAMYPLTVRMVLSGYTDLQTVTDAINRGAIYRFLTKPWEDDALRAHVREALQHGHRLREAHRG